MKENAVAHGFGQADWSRRSGFSSKHVLQRGLSSGPREPEPKLRSPKKPFKRSVPEVPAAVSIKDLEQTAKLKWLSRLERIAEEAGSYSKINQDASEVVGALTPDEKIRLRRLVLSMGSFRTMNVHIRHWERLREWAAGRSFVVYPLFMDVVLSYMISLDQRECGPTVITSVRSAINWIGGRLQMEVPDMFDLQVKALETRVIEERAKELRESPPVPIALVGMLQVYVVTVADTSPIDAVFAGWILCMIYASLRFNDAVHVGPSSLKFKDAGLFGLCWQTKVDRRRKGTRFVVARTGFKAPEWLDVWWNLLQVHAGGDRNFWMLDVASEGAFSAGPVDYARGLKVLDWVCAMQCSEGCQRG